MSSYGYQFPDVSQYSRQHTGFQVSDSHSYTSRLDSEPSSHLSSRSREVSHDSYRALEEELSRTVEKLNASELALGIEK